MLPRFCDMMLQSNRCRVMAWLIIDGFPDPYTRNRNAFSSTTIDYGFDSDSITLLHGILSYAGAAPCIFGSR